MQIMRTNKHRSLKIAGLAALFASVSVCAGVPAHADESLTAKQGSKKTSSPAKSTFCMGRFLIDVPAGSTLDGGNYKYDFIAIEPVKPSSLEEFEKEVAERESSLKSAINKRTKESMLLDSVEPEKDAKILVSWEENFTTAALAINAYRWASGSRFLFKKTVDGDKKDKGMTSVRDVLSHLRPRQDAEIPSEPGYCFGGGFVADPNWHNEEATVQIDLGGHPDAYIVITIFPLASSKHDKPLLERMGGLSQALGDLSSSVHQLRKANRKIGQYNGQEYLISASEGGMRAQVFVWETQGDGTLDTPSIKIEMTTGREGSDGNPQQTTLTDKEAVKLWDQILKSFRLQPQAAN
jgi:hypothetical protein